ncbi:hypothetical protein BG004_007118 [Podila humilis]|nr:hypothetical protein BG004_007118 [Podila humilis]
MSKVSAIEIPLIISIVACELSQPDLWSCVQVNHSFHQAFLPFLWRSINLSKRKRFRTLDLNTIRVHGSHIRHLEGIDSRNIASTQVRTICNLKSLVITLTTDARFNANCYDLIRKNIHSLQELQLSRATQPGAIVAVLPFASLILPEIFIPTPILRREPIARQTTRQTGAAAAGPGVAGAVGSDTGSGAGVSAGVGTSSSSSSSSSSPSAATASASAGGGGGGVSFGGCELSQDVSGQRLSLQHQNQHQHQQRYSFDSVPVLVTRGSVLQDVTLKYVDMTRDGFSTFLQVCPALESLSLEGFEIIEEAHEEYFQHTNIKRVKASLDQIWFPGNQSPSIPLLIHFPKLETWHFAHGPIKRTDLGIGAAVAGVLERMCPYLVNVNFGDLSGDAIFALLLNWLKRLQRVTLDYTSFQQNVLSALLVHQDTLREITIRDKGKHFDVASPPPLLGSSTGAGVVGGGGGGGGGVGAGGGGAGGRIEGKILHLIFRSCRHLERVSMPMIELDVQHMEEYPWACTGLKELHVRVKDLTQDFQFHDVLACLAGLGTLQAEPHDTPGSLIKPLQRTDIAGDKSRVDSATYKSTMTANIQGRLALRIDVLRQLEHLWLGDKMYRRVQGGKPGVFVALN